MAIRSKLHESKRIWVTDRVGEKKVHDDVRYLGNEIFAAPDISALHI